MAPRLRMLLLGSALASALGFGWAFGCSGGGDSSTLPGSGGAGASTTSATGGFGVGGFGTGGAPQAFPEQPIIEADAPSDAATLFGPAGSGDPSGGPCLVEPEPEALFPRNWLRPRFSYQAGAGENLFEVRLHAASQGHDLVAYTASPIWTMPAATWSAVTNAVVDEPITVTMRGAVYDGSGLSAGPSLGSSYTFRIAPVEAAGSIVYWTTSGGSALRGFTVGDESVTDVLVPAQVQMPASGGGQVTCIGCHTSTPDGKFASFTAQGPWSNAIASIEQASVGQAPPFITPAATAALQQADLGIHTYSKAHWQPGDRVQVAPLGSYAASELVWIDLEATQAGQGQAWDVLARNGDARGVGSPTWSHDGATIVYVSTDVEFTGRLDNGFADLYAVPYNNRLGGAATAVPGASDPALEEYYPAFSADDRLLAFNRIPNGNNMYNAALAELFVIPASGGNATRLSANDPPACTGVTSPGVTNSWPKWAPLADTAGGNTYHFMIFSSTRGGSSPKLYMTAVVVDGQGGITTHGSVYLWNQPGDQSNHTPAWDVFLLPPPN